MSNKLDPDQLKETTINIIKGVTQHFIEEHITSEREGELLTDFSETLLSNIEHIEDVEIVEES